MSDFKNYKDESRKNYGTSENTNLNLDQLTVGCLQRIADATEKMATNFTQLQNDRDMYERWFREERARTAQLQKRISSLKGVITKLKKIT